MLGLQGDPGGKLQTQANKALGSLGNQRCWAQVEAVLRVASVWRPWPNGLVTSTRPWGHLWVDGHGIVFVDTVPCFAVQDITAVDFQVA